MFIRTISAAALIAATITGPAIAQDADTVVATVDGTKITLGQMAAMKLGLPPDMANMPPAEIWDVLLNEIIRQTALANMGEKDQTPLDRAFLANQRRDYLVRAVIQRLAEFNPTDAEIQTAYEAAFPTGEPVTEYKADHILLQTKEAAQAVIEELNNGGDFTKLAEERSGDQGSAQNGGDLGWFTQDQMVKEFGDAIAGMKKGEISSSPVQTQFGWHVIKLDDTRTQTPPALDDVRDTLIQEIRREKVASEIDRISDEADVERVGDIDPEILNKDILEVELQSPHGDTPKPAQAEETPAKANSHE